MTSPHTSTTATSSTPATQVSTDIRPSPPASDELRLPGPQPFSSWLVWVGIATALAAAIWLIIAGLDAGYEAAPSVRANEAATARLQGQADQYEATRNARANQAATARLQGLADRLQSHRPDPSVEPAG